MARGATGELSSGAAVFGFDPEPRTPASRALHVLTIRRGLPRADLGPRERFAEAATRAVADAGLDVGARRGRGGQRLHLVSVEDEPGRARNVTVWYYATASFGKFGGARSSGCARTPASWRGRRPCSATSSPATTCFASTWPFMAAPKAVSAPSVAGSRSSATLACSAPCGTARWPRSGCGSRASARRRAPAAVRPSCSAIRAAAARTSSWRP